MWIHLMTLPTCWVIIKTAKDYRIFNSDQFEDNEQSNNETKNGINRDDNQLLWCDNDESEGVNVEN